MLSFTLWVTNKCNLSCVYCYEHRSIIRMEPEKNLPLEKIVDFIKRKSAEYSKEDVYIRFHGGEPLLEYDNIKKYIKLIRAEIKKRRLFFSMTTNGILLDRKKAFFLKHNIFDLSVSIDGCKLAHDQNRVYANGKGTYDYIMNNLKLSGLNKRKLRIRMTVTANNVMYLSEGVRNLINLGFSCIVPAVAIEDKEWDDNKFQLLEKELKEIKKEFYCNKNLRIAMIDRSEMRKKAECVGGIKSFNIAVNGDIYPCEYVVGDTFFKIGNVSDIQIDESKLKEIHDIRKCTICDGCTYQVYCRGTRCKYINIVNSGDYNVPPDNLCEVENIKYRVYKYEV